MFGRTLGHNYLSGKVGPADSKKISDGSGHARSPKPARPRLKMRCPKEPEHHFQNSGLPEARPILILKPDGLFGLSGFWGMGIFSRENTDLANDIL